MKSVCFGVLAVVWLAMVGRAATVQKDFTLPASAFIPQHTTSSREGSSTRSYLAAPLSVPGEKLVSGNTYIYRLRLAPGWSIELDPRYITFDMHLTFGAIPAANYNVGWVSDAGSSVRFYGENLPLAPYPVRSIFEYLSRSPESTLALDVNDWRGLNSIRPDPSKPMRLTGVDIGFVMNSGALNIPQLDMGAAVFKIGATTSGILGFPAARLVAIPEPCLLALLPPMLLLPRRRSTPR